MCQKYCTIFDALKYFNNVENNEYLNVKYYCISLNQRNIHKGSKWLFIHLINIFVFHNMVYKILLGNFLIKKSKAQTHAFIKQNILDQDNYIFCHYTLIGTLNFIQQSCSFLKYKFV